MSTKVVLNPEHNTQLDTLIEEYLAIPREDGFVIRVQDEQKTGDPLLMLKNLILDYWEENQAHDLLAVVAKFQQELVIKSGFYGRFKELRAQIINAGGASKVKIAESAPKKVASSETKTKPSTTPSTTPEATFPVPLDKFWRAGSMGRIFHDYLATNPSTNEELVAKAGELNVSEPSLKRNFNDYKNGKYAKQGWGLKEFPEGSGKYKVVPLV